MAVVVSTVQPVLLSKLTAFKDPIKNHLYLTTSFSGPFALPCLSMLQLCTAGASRPRRLSLTDKTSLAKRAATLFWTMHAPACNQERGQTGGKNWYTVTVHAEDSTLVTPLFSFNQHTGVDDFVSVYESTRGRLQWVKSIPVSMLGRTGPPNLMAPTAILSGMLSQESSTR
jgi:hypothetical protein